MSIDDNYIWPFLICVYSGKKNYSDLARVILVIDKTTLSPSNASLIKNILNQMQVKVTFVFIELSKVLTQNLHISRNSYAKIYFALKASRNFIWIDSDTLLEKNWNLIFLNLEKAILNDSVLIARTHWETLSISNMNKAYISSKGNYFNSGICIFNVKKFRIQFSADNIDDVYRKYEELRFQWSDQCVLNYLIEGRYGKLDKAFNSTPDEYNSELTRIIHYAGQEKPWLSKQYKESLNESQNNGSGYIFSAKDAAFHKYFLAEQNFVKFLSSRDLDLKTQNQMLNLVNQSNLSSRPSTTLT